VTRLDHQCLLDREHYPTANAPPYAAKAALNAITKGLAAFGPARVNTILAGPFLTDIASAWDMEAFDAMAERSIAMRRAGEPDEIVGAAMYFASESSAFTTGASLRIDGGVVGGIL
jgi:NAD(P)-dependent dehydrogenase (short-subunit alcohol dehydrogenase family)